MNLLYSDEQLVVAEKPYGLLSEEKAGEETMVSALALSLGTVYPVHRLDRTTGGLMVYARTRAAAADLSEQIRTGGLIKEYRALVQGVVTPPQGTLRDWLFYDRKKGKSFVVKRPRNGVKEAVLTYRTLAVGKACTDLAIVLQTGRTHQIRVQFAVLSASENR